MKTRKIFLLLAFVLISQLLSAGNVTAEEAKNILNTRFISISEAKEFLSDIPSNLKIPFSKETLEKFSDYWLMPIETEQKYKYFLVKINYEFELLEYNNLSLIDTLEINEGKRMIYLLNKVRPDFLGKNKLDDEFKLFFRTKTKSENIENYRQVFSYNKKKFLIADLPDDVESGALNYDYISFLVTKNGKEFIGFSPLPKEPKISEKKIIIVLTLINLKSQ